MYRRLIIRMPPFHKAALFFVQLLFLFNHNSFSQTFEKLYLTKYDDIAFDAVEVDQSYIFTVNSGDYFDENYRETFIKLDFSGEIIDSLTMVIPEGFKLYSTFRLYLLNDTILLAISPLENNIGENGIRFTHISTNFNILYDTIVCDTVITRQYYDFIIDNDSNVVVVGSNIWIEQFFISIYDLYGNKLGYNIYTNTQTGYFPSTIIDIPSRNVYHMFIYWSDDDYFFEINKETLEIQSISKYPNDFLPRNAVKGLTDSSYFIIGKQCTYNVNAWWKLSFVEMNNFGNSVNQNSYLVSPDTNSFYSYNSFDIYNGKIYFGGTYNFDNAAAYPFSIEYRWIFINKLNPDGSIIWQRFYKGDANYVLYKVLATTDGGALLLSTKYDWNSPIPLQRDLHILKVDSTGWYDGLTNVDTEQDMPKQILVYPNPATGKVHFVTGFYNNLELRIYDIQGNEVLTQHLPFSQTVDIGYLKPGLYLYLLIGENGFSEKGKLLKK